MKNVFAAMFLVLAASSALAGKTVRHNHKCPGIFRGLDVCANYEFPEYIDLSKQEATDFQVVFYTLDSSQNGGPREYVDLDGELVASLMMSHSDGGHMETPLTLVKLDVGRYAVKGAYFLMPGTYQISFDLPIPDSDLLKRAALYTYIYKDDVK